MSANGEKGHGGGKGSGHTPLYIMGIIALVVAVVAIAAAGFAPLWNYGRHKALQNELDNLEMFVQMFHPPAKKRDAPLVDGGGASAGGRKGVPVIHASVEPSGGGGRGGGGEKVRVVKEHEPVISTDLSAYIIAAGYYKDGHLLCLDDMHDVDIPIGGGGDPLVGAILSYTSNSAWEAVVPPLQQNRVHGTCPAGTQISGINDDGTVVCSGSVSPNEVGSEQIIDGTVAEVDMMPSHHKGVAGGVASLDVDGTIPPSQLPLRAKIKIHKVADILVRDAIAEVQTGDIAIVSDSDGAGNLSSFMYNEDTGTWELLDSANVHSVNNDTGDVVLTTDNVDEGAANLYYTDARADTAPMVTSHVADATLHRIIDDSNTLATIMWSGQKIASELGTKAESVHTHDAVDITGGVVGDPFISQSSVVQHEGGITHQNIGGSGNNTHADLDAHLVNTTLHRTIDDAGSGPAVLWSADKVATEVATRATSVHTHDGADLASGTIPDAVISSSSVVQHEANITHGNIGGVGTNTHAQLDTHVADTSGNPHSVSKAQIISAGSVVTADLADRSITLAKMAAGSINGVAILDGTITEADMDSSYSRGESNGIPTLGADGKVPVGQLSTVPLANVMGCANMICCDTPAPVEGTTCIVADAGSGHPETFLYDGATWLQISYPSQVTSWNGYTGTILFDPASLPAGSNFYFTARVTENANVTAGITHRADAGKHRKIKDAGSGTTDLWSASKITSELGTKAASSHVHDAVDITGGAVGDPFISESSVIQHTASIDHDSLFNFSPGKHRIINDTETSETVLWSAAKISTELAGKASSQLPVYGTEFTQGANETLLSHVISQANTWYQKLRVTTASLPSGNYKIDWYYEWGLSDNREDFRARIQLNDTTDIMTHRQRPKHSGSDQKHPACGLYYAASLSGVIDIDLDVSSTNNGVTAWIQNARITLIRVS